MEKRRRKILYTGLGVIILAALSCFLLALRFFETPRISAPSMYNAGVDVIGSLVCAVLFFGCMNQIEDATLDLISLIVINCFSFFNNELSWYVSGVPEYRTVYLALNSLAKGMDFGLVYFFYMYVRKTLSLEGKLTRFIDRASKWLLIPAFLLIAVNFFKPLCFSVDEQGVFQPESLFRLIDLYLVLLAPPTAFLVLTSGAGRRQKAVALLFFVIPILHYLITGGAFGYATQYGSVLVALVMIYCVLFNDRSSVLAATRTELRTATMIQASILPHVFPPFPDRKEFGLYATMDPTKEVGGDFYDYFMLDDDHLCLVMADVSGKSVPAALFMMVSKVTLQNCAMMSRDAAETLRNANEVICANNHVDMFVTVWLGILEISTGRLAAANAGHEYPVLKRAGGHYDLARDRHGFVIGGMAGMKYREYELKLEPGDKLFLYTDGLPEAVNPAQEAFGTERMIAALNRAPDADPEETLGNVRKAVDEFVRGAEQFDDLTMLCLEYKGPLSPAEAGPQA